jgi:hypothetical protein
VSRVVASLIATLAAVCLVASFGWSSTNQTSAGHVRRAALATLLPVRLCPTRYAEPHHVQLPTSLPVRLPPLRQPLSIYANAEFEVVAPRGWLCHAEVGEDGGGMLTVYSPTEDPFELESGVRAITAGACQACIGGLVCPLFPQAFKILGYGTSLKCSTKKPPEETVKRLSATATAFRDPPYVAIGDGDPAGGADPANGVLIFIHPPFTHPPRTFTSGLKETCTLPAAQHAVCTAILNDFLRRYGD